MAHQERENEMIVQFQIDGTTRTGRVVSCGYFDVDAPKSFEVEVNSYGFTKYIPIKDCNPL